MNTAKCRSCGAAIIWVTMIASGKKNPLNAEPDPEHGNVQVFVDGTADVKSSDPAQCKEYRDGGGRLYLSHFATCPNSKAHRKPK